MVSCGSRSCRQGSQCAKKCEERNQAAGEEPSATRRGRWRQTERMDFCRRGCGDECTEQTLDVQGASRAISTRLHPTPTRCSAGDALWRCAAAQYDNTTPNDPAATADDNTATDNTTPNDPATTDHTTTTANTTTTSVLKIRPIKIEIQLCSKGRYYHRLSLRNDCNYNGWFLQFR